VVSGRAVLAAVALMLIGAGPASAVQKIEEITNIPIGTSGQNLQTGKLHPGAASNCTSPKTAPTVDPGSFRNAGFDYESHINEPTCLTIEYSTTDAACQTNGLFSAAYIAGFNPSAIQTHYAGDVGAAPASASPVSYSVLLPAGQRLSIDFHMSTPGAGCAGFNFKVFSDQPWIYFSTPITGHPFVGRQLRSREEVWEDSSNSTFTRQWRRCARDGSSCVDIPGATAQTYVPVPDDVGHALRVHVSATDGGLTSTSDSDPQVIGVQFDAADGQALAAPDTTQTGRIAPTQPASGCDAAKATPALTGNPNPRFYDLFHHTNDSDGTVCAIVSALPTPTCPNRLLSAAYLPGFVPANVVENYLADSGSTANFGAATARYSFPVPAGAAYDVVVSTFDAVSGPSGACTGYDVRFGTASPYPTGAPTVEGTAQAGQSLSAGDGSWTGAPQSFAYQWQRCFGDGSGCGDIPGATAKTLALGDRNVGDSFRVRVTATEGIGSASRASAPSAEVAEGPPSPPPPAYAGIALKGLTKVVGAKRLVTLNLKCPAEAVLGCTGSDAIKLGKSTLGFKPFAMLPGKSAKLTFKLAKRPAKGKTLKATQVVNSFDSRGVVVKTSAKLTLKRR
jgi:hypothetical protein